MKIKHFLTVFCLIFCLAAAFSISAAADETSKTEETQDTRGWNKDEKGQYYIKSNGRRAVGPYKAKDQSGNSAYFFFDSDGYLVEGAAQIVTYKNNNYLISAQGTIYVNGLKLYRGKFYYAAKNGALAKNRAVTIGSNTYCFSTNTRMYTATSLRTVGGKKYLIKRVKTSKGYMGVAQTGWQTYKGKKYFFDSRGVLKTGMVKEEDGDMYYNSSKGVKTGSFKANGKYYYADKNGKLVTGWVKRNGNYYYYSPKNGAMVKDKFIKKDGNIYYVNSKGVRKRGWFDLRGKRYYAKPSSPNQGALYISWQEIGGRTYCFNTRGELRKGWLESKKKGGVFYLHPSKGYVMTGDQNINGKWYYFNSSGVMQTGWVTKNGRTYYYTPSGNVGEGKGAMVTGKVTISGRTYTFDSSGRLQVQTTNVTRLEVNRQANVITAYSGSTPIKAMICSTGAGNATPTGTFSAGQKILYHQLNGPTWGWYCTRLAPTSDILFHSVPMTNPVAPNNYRDAATSLFASKYNLLGQQASSGCIRMTVADAKWMYNNVPTGTPIIISDTCATPLGKPSAQKISSTLGYDPTDTRVA